MENDILAGMPEGSTIQDFPVAQLLSMIRADHAGSMSQTMRSALQASLKQFNQVIPLIINQKTNQLVSGHQVVYAAEAQKFKRLSAIVVDLSEPEQLALGMALKNSPGEWNQEKLAGFLLLLSPQQREVTGLNQAEINYLIKSETTPTAVGHTLTEVEVAILSQVTAAAVSSKLIKFGDLSIRVSDLVYRQWLTAMINESSSGNTMQSLGRLVAKKCGINELMAD